jgi:serine/threonine protein kinase/formylglycine-generating enzyme required for sulfatase activity
MGPESGTGRDTGSGLSPHATLTEVTSADMEQNGVQRGNAVMAPNSGTPEVDVYPATGTTLHYFGDYELHEEIARGGMGVVYRARQVRLNRQVALKMIRAGKFSSDTEIQRLRVEAEAAAQLDHPAIVPVFEVGEHEGLHYFTMAFVDGEPLSAKLSAGPMSVQSAAKLIQVVAEAVAYAHAKGVIHRDLKPGNILIDRTGQPRVSDFGLAKQVSLDNELTVTGQILGTPSYMPREQALGRLGEVNQSSDIYSLGAVLYATLTGRPPFQAASSVETLRQVVDEQPVAPRQLNPSIPRDLETICLKCLEKERSGRYSSAQDLANDLLRYLSGHPISARPISRLERIWRWTRRHPDLSLALMALGLLMCGTLIAVRIQRQQHAQIEQQTRVAGLIHTIESADFRELPRLVDELCQFPEHSVAIQELSKRKELTGSQEHQLRIDLATSVLSGKIPSGVLEQWGDLSLQELVVVRQITRALRPQYLSSLREILRPEVVAYPERLKQLRAAGLLLAETERGESRNGSTTIASASKMTSEYELIRWGTIAETLLQVLSENPRDFDSALLLFQPAAQDLYEPLKALLEKPSVSYQQRHLATALLCELMRDSPNAMAEIACLTDENSLQLMRRHVDRMAVSIVPSLIAELRKPDVTVKEAGESLSVASQKKLATQLVEQRASEVRRKAMAAAWLFRLGMVDFVWPLLKKRPDDSLRYAVIDRIRFVGGATEPVFSELQLATERSRRNTATTTIELDSELRMLLLLVGEMAEQIRDKDRENTVQLLANLFENHPDSGVHSCCEWTLNQLDAASEILEIRDRHSSATLTENRNWYVTASGATMAVIRGPVTFQMGADWTDPDRLANDSVNPVTGVVTLSDEERYMQREIPRDFAIGLKEVSLTEFLPCEKDFHDRINQFMSPTVDYPANKVNWYLAARYCNWLSEKEGLDESEWCFIPDIEGRYGEGLTLAENYLHRRGYRMPTEAEWEYACRAGTTTPRFFGHCRELFPQYVWYSENSKEQTLIVPGTLKPNDLGLFDVFGNVIEWCIDPYKNRPLANGGIVPDLERGLSADAESWRVLRGGHLYADEPNIRAADLWTFRPLTSDGHYGLRLARTLKTYDRP